MLKASGRRILKEHAVPTKFLDGWKPEVEDNVSKPLSSGGGRLYARDDGSNALEVEEVLLNEAVDMELEFSPLKADMFCRLCGIKTEEDSTYALEELQNEQQVDDVFKMCMLDNQTLEEATSVCLGCYSEIKSIVNFVRKCHEGQHRLLDQLSEQMEVPIPEQSEDDEEDTEYSDETTNQSNEDDFGKEERKIARMDRYIDKLIVKYKYARDRPRVTKTWECFDCGEVFQRRNHLAKHRNVCTLVGSEDSKRRGPFRCELCDKLLSTLPGYRYHLMKMHDSNVEDDNYPEELRSLKSNKVVTCPICSEKFATAAKLRYHLPSHKSTNQGRDSEGKTGATQTSSNAMCTICGKMISSPAALEVHMKFHLKQKDWQCDRCNKQYYTKADLKKHVLSEHERITYTCENCGMVLKSKITYTRHKRIHDVSLQKACSYCPKRFTTTNSLNKHVQRRHRPQEMVLSEETQEHKQMHGNREARWDKYEQEETGVYQDIIEEEVVSEAELTIEVDSKNGIKQEAVMVVETFE